MSDVVEKTFAALPKIFSETLLLGQNSGLDKQKLSPGLGPCYQNFVRMLHKCRTKNVNFILFIIYSLQSVYKI